MELKRRAKEVFYWKSATREVDFIVRSGLQIEEAIQVCWNLDHERTRKGETRALYSAMETFNLDKGIVITEDAEEMEEVGGKQIFFVPIWKWFLGEMVCKQECQR